MKKIIFPLFLFSLFVISCENLDEGDCDNYVISKGNHYSSSSLRFLKNCSSRIEFVFTIDTSMFYNPLQNDFINGHNKVRGIVCMSELNITSYSARITWRCRSINEMDIGFIVHLPSQKEPILGFLLTNVNRGDEIYCVIEDMGKSGFYFSAENLRSYDCANQIIKKNGAGIAKNHKLIDAPFFGGEEEAPHNIFVKICTII